MCCVFCEVYMWPFHQGQSLDRSVAAEYPKDTFCTKRD